MSRSTKFEDLNISYQRGPRVAIFEPSYFLSLPRKALIRTLKTLEALDKSVADGLLNKEGSIDNNNNETVIYYLRPTDEDRERKLRGAQSEWDRTKKYYENPASAPRLDALYHQPVGRSGRQAHHRLVRHGEQLT